MNPKLQRSLFLLALVAAPFVTQVAACTGQAEGERCEQKNGNDDCADNLVCKSSKELGGNADICCPAGQSTNPECIPGGGTTSTGETTTTSSGGGAGTTSSVSTVGATTATSSSESSSSESSSAAATGTGGSSTTATGGG
jgi:hypothetical protein